MKTSHKTTRNAQQEPTKADARNIIVVLRLDQWPVVLRSMEMAAKESKKTGRDLAEAVILETRIEVRKQIEKQVGTL